MSGEEAIQAFGRLGFRKVRQKGSHAILKKDGHRLLLSVPVHDELRTGTLHRLIRDAGITDEEFLAAR